MRRAIGIIGAAGLILLGAAYWLTVEPAPRVRVRWRPDVPPAQRATLAEKYLLLNARDRLPEESWAYDLLDTSESNIRAIVAEPGILDTDDIERHTFVVRFDTDYGAEWMWIAHRTPGLRRAGVRVALVLTLALLAIGGFAKDGWRAWRAKRVHRRDGV